MLSEKVHVTLGSVEVKKVESWAQKQIRFMEAITKHSFQNETEQAYNDLMELAINKGFSKWDFEDLNSLDKFIALIKQDIAVIFAEEVSKEPFLEKSHEEVENETVSSTSWITEQIIRTKKIIQEKILRVSREKARIEFRKNHSGEEYYYDCDDCECYD